MPMVTKESNARSGISATRLPFGGSSNSISAAAFLGSESFDVRVVSPFRMVMDAGSLDRALTSLAPGQSEHPGNAHYRDGFDDWFAGNAGLLVTDLLLVRESGAMRLVLEPLP